MAGIREMPPWFDIKNYDTTNLNDEQILQQILLRKELYKKLSSKCNCNTRNLKSVEQPSIVCLKKDDCIKLKLGFVDDPNQPKGYFDYWSDITNGNPYSFEYSGRFEWESDHVHRQGVSYCRGLYNEINRQSVEMQKRKISGGNRIDDFHISPNLTAPYGPNQYPHLFHLALEDKTDKEILNGLEELLPIVREKLQINELHIKKLKLKERKVNKFKKSEILKIRKSVNSLAILDIDMWQKTNENIAVKVIARALGPNVSATTYVDTHLKSARKLTKNNFYYIEKN
jgi:hypothetical protein